MERPRRLSAAFVQTITAPGRYGDGRGGLGLSLLVKYTIAGGLSKSWSQRLRIDGQPFNVGLGGFPRVTLAKARAKALANVRMLEDGIDPRVKPVTILTFAAALESTIEVLRPGWKSDKTEKQLRFLLGEYALPTLGKKPVDKISPSDILAVMVPLALEKPATAGKLKTQLGQVFKWSIAHGHRTDNPADQNINAALPSLSTREHRKALPYADVPGAVKTIRESSAWLGTKLAFEFLVLTACRSGEVRLAQWEEIDLEGAVWTIPGHRMKSSREHRIPLSDRAMNILTEAATLGDVRGLVFPSPTGKALFDNTISKLVRQNGIPAVPHGFRSSFRNWCAEANIDRQTAESALAHSLGGATETAYLRSDLFALRRAAMDGWAKHLDEASATL